MYLFKIGLESKESTPSPPPVYLYCLYSFIFNSIKCFLISVHYPYIIFCQPGKCLYTTVRELVENALDSAESISELPIIEITL